MVAGGLKLQRKGFEDGENEAGDGREDSRHYYWIEAVVLTEGEQGEFVNTNIFG